MTSFWFLLTDCGLALQRQPQINWHIDRHHCIWIVLCLVLSIVLSLCMVCLHIIVSVYVVDFANVKCERLTNAISGHKITSKLRTAGYINKCSFRGFSSQYFVALLYFSTVLRSFPLLYFIPILSQSVPIYRQMQTRFPTKKHKSCT